MDIDLVGVCKLGKPRVGMGEGGVRLSLGAWLGPEGKRAVWIERSLIGHKKLIVAVSFDRHTPAGVPVGSGDNLQGLCEIAPRIESSDIFTVESWDLMANGKQSLPNPNRSTSTEGLKYARNYLTDDVVRCAFSEATGKIVLGTLTG